MTNNKYYEINSIINQSKSYMYCHNNIDFCRVLQVENMFVQFVFVTFSIEYCLDKHLITYIHICMRLTLNKH